MNGSDLLNQEIARELMLQINPNLSQEQFEKVYNLCGNNPWNAPILYKLLDMLSEQTN